METARREIDALKQTFCTFSIPEGSGPLKGEERAGGVHLRLQWTLSWLTVVERGLPPSSPRSQEQIDGGAENSMSSGKHKLYKEKLQIGTLTRAIIFHSAT